MKKLYGLAASGLLALGVLAGCTQTPGGGATPVITVPTLTPAQLTTLASGAQTIANDVNVALPGILKLLGSNDVKNVTAANTAIQGAVTDLVAIANSQAATGTPISDVMAIENGLNVIVGAAATVPLIPEPYQAYLVAASVALPAVEGVINLVIQQNTPVAATVAAMKVSAPAPKR